MKRGLPPFVYRRTVKGRVMELAFAGCSDEEIGAISGHESLAMIKKYAGIARQVMFAKSANKKREA